MTAFAGRASAPSEVQKADSLFIIEKYTEALVLYESSFNNGQASPAMLLKMAFINEGLRKPVSSLFYLHHYYKMTADRDALLQMQELAEENDLLGYTVGDKDFMYTNLIRFQLEIRVGLSALAFILLVATVISRRKNRMPIGLPIIQVLVLALLLVVINDWLKPDQAIINEGTLLMTGPSAASEYYDYVDSGHKVEVIGESDIWAKISWDGEEVYIRKGKLLRL